MSVPFLPLVLLFIVALTTMLVGLYFSSKTSAANQPDVEDTFYRRATRPERPSRSISVGSSGNYVKQIERYTGSRDGGKVVRVSNIPTSSSHFSDADIILRNLLVGSRQELISNQAKGRYVLGTSRRSYSWLLFFLICGLVFGGSIFFLYREINSTSSNSLFVYSYQSAAKITPDAVSPQIPQGFSGASKALKRLAQMDPGQYNSQQQYDAWAASACSTTAMTEVIDAYGYSYHISDVLQAEIGQSAISPELGLLQLNGIDHTVAQFGFSTAQLSRAPLDSLISVANSGWPIIVDFPPSGDWPTGHFLVVRGGDSSNVMLADSSSENWTSISRQQFLRDWGGYAVVVMPKGQ